MEKEQYMSLSEAAEFLQLTNKAVLYHVRSRNLPATMIGHSYVLLRADVETFRNKRAGGRFVR